MIDYQQIVDLCAQIISISMPIGIIFGLSEMAVNAFMQFVFGKNRVKF